VEVKVFEPVAPAVPAVLEVKPGNFETVPAAGVPATLPAVAPVPTVLPTVFPVFPAKAEVNDLPVAVVPAVLFAIAFFSATVEPFRADVTAVLG
jgi:hypothetical protein